MSKLCVFCKSEIHDDALKCKECGGYQNWKRHVDFSNTVLALLLALLSVSTVAVPVFVKAFHKERSDVSIILREARITPWSSGGIVGGDEVSVSSLGLTITCLVTNSGEKPGFIEDASYKILKNGAIIGSGQLDIDEAVVPSNSFRIQTMRGSIKVHKEGELPTGVMSRAHPPKVQLEDIEISIRVIQNNLAVKEIVFHRRGEDWSVVL